MARTIRVLFIFCITAAFLAGGVVVARSQSNTESNMVRAGIGILIKSGEQTIRARGTDVLNGGDRFQIHVKPEGNLHVYVVRTDGKIATLLKEIEPGGPVAELVLPAPQEYYKLGGENSKETITVICGPDKLKELSILADPRLPSEKWVPVEQELLARGGIGLDTVSEKPFPIAGAVKETMGGEPREREIPKEPKVHASTGEFPIFSGNTILVKRYVFTIKK